MFENPAGVVAVVLGQASLDRFRQVGVDGAEQLVASLAFKVQGLRSARSLATSRVPAVAQSANWAELFESFYDPRDANEQMALQQGFAPLPIGFALGRACNAASHRFPVPAGNSGDESD